MNQAVAQKEPVTKEKQGGFKGFGFENDLFWMLKEDYHWPSVESRVGIYDAIDNKPGEIDIIARREINVSYDSKIFPVELTLIIEAKKTDTYRWIFMRGMDDMDRQIKHVGQWFFPFGSGYDDNPLRMSPEFARQRYKEKEASQSFFTQLLKKIGVEQSHAEINLDANDCQKDRHPNSDTKKIDRDYGDHHIYRAINSAIAAAFYLKKVHGNDARHGIILPIVVADTTHMEYWRLERRKNLESKRTKRKIDLGVCKVKSFSTATDYKPEVAAVLVLNPVGFKKLLDTIQEIGIER